MKKVVGCIFLFTIEVGCFHLEKRCSAKYQENKERDFIKTQKNIINQIYFDGYTFSFEAREEVVDFNQSKSISDCRYVWAGDGRSIAIVDVTKDGVKNRTLEVRSDGMKEYRTVYFQDGTHAIDTIKVAKSSNDPSGYPGWMTTSAWAFMPGGKTIGQSIKDGAELTEDTKNRRRVLILKQKSKDRDISSELDPQHDYLPRQLEAINAKTHLTITVTSYERSNGHWYPKTGRGTLVLLKKEGNNETNYKFVVSNASINQSMDSSELEMPIAEEGVLVDDATDKSRKTKGGYLARTILQDKHRVSLSGKKLTESPISVVDRGYVSFSTICYACAAVSASVCLAFWIKKDNSQ